MKIRPHGGLCGLLVLTLPALAQPVEIRVDAAAVEGPFRPIYAYFGYDEPNYTYTANGRKLIGELAALEPGARRDSHAPSAGDGRWHAGAEVGLDQRLHRRRRRQAGLRLDHRRPHLRHLRAGERQAVRRDRLHAAKRSPSNPEPYTAELAEAATARAGRIRPRITHKWAELVRQWVLHAVARYGKAEVEIVVVGAVERARHFLLARHAGGVRQAVRLHRRRHQARAARGARGRTRHHRAGVAEGRGITCSSSWSTARTA